MARLSATAVLETLHLEFPDGVPRRQLLDVLALRHLSALPNLPKSAQRRLEQARRIDSRRTDGLDRGLSRRKVHHL